MGIGLSLFAAQLVLSVPPPAPTATGEQILLAAETPVQLVTVDPLDSRTARQGQRFALRVSEDVKVESAVVIPRGTAAVGEVESVSGKGMVGKAGHLGLRPLFIDVAGERVFLSGLAEQNGKDSTAGVAVGSLLLSGWGIFITGKSASLPAGSALAGRVRTDVILAAAPGQPAQSGGSPTTPPAITTTEMRP
jgi:hypothetical protein